jgi:hypothetical protein
LARFAMTHATATVLLHWLIDAAPDCTPRGRRFALPARFDHQGEDWMTDAWSLVVDVTGPPDGQGYQVATVRFLMPQAPHVWLSAGKRFTLFEGRLPVAEGEIREAAHHAEPE